MVFDEASIARVRELSSKPVALGGWLGRPYETRGCVKFLMLVFEHLGLQFSEDMLRERRHFARVKEPRFADIAVFKDMPGAADYHVAFMLDYRIAVQCSESTNGVGKIDVRRYPVAERLSEFLRLKDVSDS